MHTLNLTTEVAHRGGMAMADDDLHPPRDILPRIGGIEAIGQIFDGLYDRIEADKVLRPMFGRKLDGEREAQRVFFNAWLGGDPGIYAGHGGGMKSRHEGLFISRDLAGRWLGHFKASVSVVVSDKEAATDLLHYVQALAFGLVNRSVPPTKGDKLRFCHSPSFKGVSESIKLDDGDGVRRQFGQVSDRPDGEAEHLFQIACALGRMNAVEALLEQGVDPNRASNHALGIPGHTSVGWTRVLVTPLCVAMAKKRPAVVELLSARGAKYDIFSATYLGDVDSIKKLLNADSSLANVADPATDVYGTTPLLHAVFSGRTEAAMVLLAGGARVDPFSALMMQWAAASGDGTLVDLILDHGGQAAGVGPGKWVKDPAIASRLLAAGADVNSSPGHWIWLACTGNSGHKEDPEYVRALLLAGADVNATYSGATALHYATRAGFARVMQILLEYGADADAVDKDGRQPSDWAAKRLR